MIVLVVMRWSGHVFVEMVMLKVCLGSARCRLLWFSCPWIWVMVVFNFVILFGLISL